MLIPQPQSLPVSFRSPSSLCNSMVAASRRWLSRVAVMAVAVIVASSCSRAPVYKVAEGVVWHTSYRIVYQSDTDLSDVIIAAMDSVEQSLSPFLASSVISRVNNGQSSRVDSLVSQVWGVARRVWSLSGGMFDPTVAPLVRLWGFGGEEVDSPPSRSAIDSCLMSVGFGDCRLDGLSVVKKSPVTSFNFSAVTKGFGVDRVAMALEGRGVADYLVEIGGEVRARGVNTRGEKWRISVDVPDSSITPGEASLCVIEPGDCGVATSGNYRNYRDFNGRRAGHTISPVSGLPVDSEVLSATVVAPSCAEADALATALMAMPLSDGIAMMESLGSSYQALIVVDRGSGMEVITVSR